MTVDQALWHGLQALWAPTGLAVLMSLLLKLPGPWGARPLSWRRVFGWSLCMNCAAYGAAWIVTGHEGSMAGYGGMVAANACVGYALGLHARQVTRRTPGRAASAAKLP